MTVRCTSRRSTSALPSRVHRSDAVAARSNAAIFVDGAAAVHASSLLSRRGFFAIPRHMKRVISTENAPAAIGPYSQAIAVRATELVFCSGQIPIDPQTKAVLDGPIEVQTERVLDNIKALLAAADCTFSDVVKTTIFLADMNDFAKVNELYAVRFPKDPPARSTVQAARLPRDVKVEIEVIAAKH